MARVHVRPATREDVVAFTGSCPHTVRAFVGEVGGEIVALGGLSFVRGRVIAFCNLSDRVREHPKTLHKAALAVMRQALDSGHRFIFAERDPDEPTALRWLRALGFKPVDNNEMAFVWQP